MRPDGEPIYYEVSFLVGLPLEYEDIEWWTTLRHVIVHVRKHDAWVSWESEPDPVMEVDWQTRIALLAINKPWDAVWEYVDPGITRVLHPDRDEDPPEPESDDDDDIFDRERNATPVLGGVGIQGMAQAPRPRRRNLP